MSSHPLKNPHGVRRLFAALRCSIDGLKAAFVHESAFRQELMLSMVMLPGAWWLGRNWIERALLMGSVVLVLIVELLNSAVEAAVDRISLDLHPMSKRAKDIGSAAVLLALLLCGGIWASAIGMRFWP